MLNVLKKVTICIISFVLFSFIVKADDIDFDLYSDKQTVEPGETISVSILLEKIADEMELNDLSVGLNFSDDIFEFVEEKNHNYVNLEDFELTNTYKIIDGIIFRIASEDNTITKDLNKTDIIKNIKLKVKDVDNQTTKIWVTDEFNLKQKSISINIYKKDGNSSLNKLSVSGFDLEPKFDKAVTNYTLTVPYEKDKIEIKAECNSRNCKVENDGTKELEVGINTINVVVYSEDENETTYTLEVTRLGASDDNSLSSLELVNSNNEVIDFKFESNKTIYDLSVKNDIIFVTYNALCSGLNCKIDNNRGTKKLEVGNNNIKIKVTSENNKERTYSININREEAVSNKKINPIVYYLIIVLVIGLIILIILLRNYYSNKDMEEILDCENDDDNDYHE